MQYDFWKQSASSLREEKLEKKKEETKSQSVPVLQKDFFTPLHKLENAYGSLTFGIKEGRIAAMAARKSEFMENTMDNSRKKLQLQRLQRHQNNGGTLWTDTHFQKESAAVYEEREKDTAPEMVFRHLRQTIIKKEQNTWLEMLPEKKEIEKKVLQSLKKTRGKADKLPEEKKEESVSLHPVIRKINEEAEAQIEEDKPEENEDKL